jgi:hypothetical protein
VALDLAAAEATPFSRYIAGAWIPGSPILKRPIRILVAVANPSNLADFGLAAIDPDARWSASSGRNVKISSNWSKIKRCGICSSPSSVVFFLK